MKIEESLRAIRIAIFLIAAPTFLIAALLRDHFQSPVLNTITWWSLIIWVVCILPEMFVTAENRKKI